MLQDSISSAVIDVYISIFSFPIQNYMEVSHDTLKTLIYICIKKKKATKKANRAPRPNCVKKIASIL